MISDKLNKIIHDKLYSELSNVEIIPYNNRLIWFIDREREYWYFIYDVKNSQLWWRYDFFSSFFSVFSLHTTVYTPIISSWVEGILIYNVDSMRSNHSLHNEWVKEALNHTVKTTENRLTVSEKVVNNVLNYEVNANFEIDRINKVLNHKVIKTETVQGNLKNKMSEVLNYKVSKTMADYSNTDEMVGEVLNSKV